ncbi:CheR family methyltransferase [Rubinisphaera margarita]|uniref:CheR family methyltransferase n=1 Tax=Rubinisphaera margarita TaxID=2909586 RepID=UPI001EE998E0|nr:CheR family methyltransferase [Rubinisphaera margarita]MCG6156250.1 protein-glutamate O-methyltransferase CheR [Rubinisphaera margarita]
MTDRIIDLEIKLLLEAVFEQFHYDFRGYSMASIKRRLRQALTHFRCETVSQLQGRVLHEADAFPQLLSYLTVQVSELFRDPTYFKALREQVLPHLRTYPSLKIWVAGCGDGEEVYSLAIMLREEGLEDRTLIYGTDVNPKALRKAEAGVYAVDRIPLFTRNHQLAGGKSSLSDYYTAAYGGAAFDKSLTRNVVFSDHSLVSDAVFAEMHLISCRNVLIYFDRQLQNRAVELMKESLIRRGFLGLGSRETLRFTEHAEAFTDFAKDVRIYQKRGDQ